MNRIFGVFACSALSLALAGPAAAEPANLLGVFGNWSAYTTGTGSSQTCYVLSKPRATRPAGTKRSAVIPPRGGRHQPSSRSPASIETFTS